MNSLSLAAFFYLSQLPDLAVLVSLPGLFYFGQLALELFLVVVEPLELGSLRRGHHREVLGHMDVRLGFLRR